MKRSTIIFIIIFVIFITNCNKNKEKTIQLDTKITPKQFTYAGGTPYRLDTRGLIPLDDNNPLYKKVKLPSGYDDLKLMVYHFQRYQYLYNKYLKGELSEDKYQWYKSFESYNEEILTKEYVDEDLIIGVKLIKDSTIVFIDTDNDNELIDEISYKFKNINSLEEEKLERSKIKPTKVVFEYYDGKLIKKKTTHVRVNPCGFLHSHTIGGKKATVELELCEYLLGSIEIEKLKYPISISFYHSAGIYKNNNIIIHINETSRNSEPILNKKPIRYEIGDIINLGEHDIKLKSIALSGESLTIIDLGINKNPIGVSVENHAPDFYVKDINNEYISLNNIQSKYILLDFWFTACFPCRRELITIKELYNQYKKEDLAIIGIAREKNVNAFKKFIEEENLNWYQIMDSTETIISKYKVHSYPTTYIIDSKRKILFRNLRGEELSAKIKELIDK